MYKGLPAGCLFSRSQNQILCGGIRMKDDFFLMPRRRFAWLLALAGLGTACKKEETVMSDMPGTDMAATEMTATAPLVPKRPKRIADVHTHMFNANFLPLDGV